MDNPRRSAEQLTLSDFPEAFQPLVVVTGDRREDRPKTKGDLLAYSVSNIDMTYILQLGLRHAEIVTDKMFVLHDASELKELYGDTHILVIGSPAVNLLTRQLNNQNAFRFDIPEEAKRDVHEHDKIIDSIKFSQIDLSIYKAIFERGLSPDEIIKQDFADFPDKAEIQAKCKYLFEAFNKLNLNDRQWRHFIHKFDRPGIIDFIDGKTHGTRTTPYNDFGLISVTSNPFSTGSYFAITVAGVHGIATAYGVKLLASRSSLDDRPFGGVYEVQFPEFGSWSQRLLQVQIKWQTRPYRTKLYTQKGFVPPSRFSKSSKGQGFDFFVSSPYTEGDEHYQQLNESLQAICEDYFLRTETAYSVKTSPRGTFPRVIGETIASSSAVIHLLNEFKPGVLFEVGLSIGHKKQVFLAWDRRFGKLDHSQLPQAISKVNIIQFDSSDPDEFKSKIVQDVIEPSLDARKNPSDISSIRDVVPKFPRKSSKPRTYCYNSSLFKSHMDELYSLLLDVFQAPAFAGTELDADGFLASQCSGLGKATQCIFLLDPEDRDGLLLLGIAEALKKPTLLLSESHISMWEGEFKQLAQSTIDRDLRKSVEDFMKKVRTKRKRGPRYESSFDRVTQPTHPTIELTIDTEYDTFTTAEEAKLLKRIQELLGMPSIPKVADKEVGSVKLKLPLDPSLAQKLFWAVKTGELESFNVKDARLLGDALAQAIVADKTRKHDFDVFLCHNSLDKKEVKRVGNKLKKFGLRPWLDEWVLRPGMPWQRALEEQIESIGAVAVFIGENGRGPWQDLEIEGFIRQFVKRDCPVIPVVLANCCGSPNWPPFLDGMQSVSFQHRRPDPMEQLVYGITGNRFSSD